MQTEAGSTLRSGIVTSDRNVAVSDNSYDSTGNTIANGLECHLVGDVLLVAAAQAGEERAFVELCARNRQRAFGMIHRLTKNREDTEDVLQKSMMRAFLHLKDFDGRSSFGTCLFASASDRLS